MRVRLQVQMGPIRGWIDDLINEVRGPVKRNFLEEMGKVGLEVLREEMPEGKTGKLKAESVYEIFEETETQSSVGWWSNARTSDGKRLDIIVDQGPGQPKKTKGSPGRYVPAIGKRLKNPRRSFGTGREAAYQFARELRLKLPYKDPKVHKVGLIEGGQMEGFYKPLDYKGPYTPYTPGTEVERGEIALAAQEFLYNIETKDDEVAATRMLSQEEFSRVSFHEHLHAIFDYNKKYGTVEQKEKIKWLIDGGLPAEEDYIMRHEEEWSHYAGRSKTIRDRLAAKRAKGPKLDIVGAKKKIEDLDRAFKIDDVVYIGDMAGIVVGYSSGIETAEETFKKYGETGAPLEMKGHTPWGMQTLAEWAIKGGKGYKVLTNTGTIEFIPEYELVESNAGAVAGVNAEVIRAQITVQRQEGQSIGWHPGSKRTPFYSRAHRRIKQEAGRVLEAALEGVRA